MEDAYLQAVQAINSLTMLQLRVLTAMNRAPHVQPMVQSVKHAQKALRLAARYASNAYQSKL